MSCWGHVVDLVDLDLIIDLFSRSQAMVSQADKKQRVFDKTLDDWKKKCSDVTSELEQTNSEGRAQAALVYQLRAQLEQSGESAHALRKENKNLTGIVVCVVNRLRCSYQILAGSLLP